MTSKFAKFKLLFWKNWLLQWRQKRQTMWEILVPVVLSILLVLIRSLVEIEPVDTPTVYEPFSPFHLPKQNLSVAFGGGNNSLGNLDPTLNAVLCDILLFNKFPFSDYTVQKEFAPLLKSEVGQKRLMKQLRAQARDFLVDRWFLLYSPKTDEMVTFMDNVRSYHSVHNRFIVCGANNSSHLDSINTIDYDTFQIPIMLLTLAKVYFPDSLQSATKLPKKMDVVIRFPGERRIVDANETADQAQSGKLTPLNWYTQLLFPLFQVPGPRNYDEEDGGSPGYWKEGFIALQSLISETFLRYHKPEITPPEVLLQRFPFPPYIDDPLLQAMEGFIPLVIMLSFVYSSMSIVRLVTTEKEKQLKEAMKVMGLPNWLHWTAWFVKTIMFLTISVLLITILMKAPLAGADRYVLTYCDPTLLFFFLFVFAMASITFCFVVSSFFSKANIAAIFMGLFWLLSYFPYMLLQNNYSDVTLATKIVTSLLSNTAVGYGFQIILMYEGTGQGAQWDNLWTPVTPQDTLTMGHVMLMLFMDCIIYMIITIYVEGVYPGDFGVPLPFYFPFTRKYWIGEKVDIDEPHETEVIPKGCAVAEAEPKHLRAGVQIENLKKVYSNKKVAVDGLTLNMYEGQITVLLGHNGAGKTTTMSMLTGLYTPTSGTARINGHDIRKDMDGVREDLGLCPQYNVLFDDLTVTEHLIFFGKLKGLTGKALDEEAQRFISLLELEDKANKPSNQLSGGMQRKLAAAVALCGGSKVVLFDEPTSGMDPSARRALWDLLQSEKAGRTILLTTHFMDEADVLGDRIAIMSEGRLQCVGSSFFLKKQYGGGYHLVLVKTPHCVPELVTEELAKFMPGITPQANVGAELSYHLEDKYQSEFEEIFTNLENKKIKLGIESYGVSLTTMEEVFIKVGSDQEVGNDESEENSQNPIANGNGINNNHETSVTLGRAPLLEGFALLRNQTLAMFFKYMMSTYRSWMLYLIIVIIPILDISTSMAIGQTYKYTDDLPARSFSLKDYKEGVVTLANNNGDADLVKIYQNIVSGETSNVRNLNDLGGSLNVSNYLLEKATEDIGTVSQTYVLGTSFEENKIIGLFNNQPYHVPPLALKHIYNSLLRYYVGDDAEINFVNHPQPYTAQTKVLLLQSGGTTTFQIAFNLGFSFAFIASYYVVFYVRERVSKAKLLQFVSGVNVVTFWVTGFLWNILISLGPILAIIITLACFQEDGFSTAAELGRCFVILLCSIIACLPMTYLASFLFEVPAGGFSRLMMFNEFTGVAAFIVIMVLQTPSLDLKDTSNILDWIFTFLPAYSVTYSFSSLSKNYLITKACTSSALNLRCDVTQNVCCRQSSQCPGGECAQWTEDYFDFQQPGVGRNISVFFIVSAVMFALLMIIEHNIFEMVTYSFRKPKVFIQESNDPADSDVKAENEKIATKSAEDRKDYNLMLQGLTKYYSSFRAVNNLNLGVKQGECFGLLGVNGAGKTTTFKMMTGDERISFGDAFVQGLSLKYSMKQVRQNIGYCPQFDALLDDLTGRETMRMFCLLRGVPNREVTPLSEKLAKELLFFKHIDKKVKEYSGGNKRKLSTAVALIGDPPVVYLDEPTTGMDPVAKRHLWNVIIKIRDAGKTIILTSHSMEECEALCTRLAIMVNGEFKCLGSTQHLKSKFAEGYTLTIKMKRSSREQERRLSKARTSHTSFNRALSVVSVDSPEEIEKVRSFVTRHFPGAELREEILGMLTYHLPKSGLAWASMFGIMERGKSSLSIEDYSLGQTSLEQVFLHFTKYQN